jgi:hypothetical protein
MAIRAKRRGQTNQIRFRFIVFPFRETFILTFNITYGVKNASKKSGIIDPAIYWMEGAIN